MSTKISDLRLFIRALLGDVESLGVWQYANDQIDSAVRTVFATGNAPAGYALSTTDGTVAQFSASTLITPALSGIALSRVLYEAAILIAVGIAGATDIRTRSLTVKEGGERKLSLLIRFREELGRIDEEAEETSPFDSSQSLTHWIIANNGGVDAWGFASTMTYSGGSPYAI